MLNLVKKISTYLEEGSAPLVYFFLSFFFVVSLRNFSELFSTNMYIELGGFLHLYAFWFSLAPAVILIFYFFSKTNIIKLIKLVLPFFALINIAPLLDKIISGGSGYKMAYLFPDADIKILNSFFTFFGEFSGPGITPGIRIEIAIILLLSAFYIFSKNRSILKTILAVTLEYFTIFTYLAFPFVLYNLLPLFGLKYTYSNALMSSSFLLLSLLLWGLVAYFSASKYFLAILRDIRPERLIHFEAMFLLGAILGLNHYSDFSLNTKLLFQIIFSLFAILFAWIFSVMSNNLSDIEIDKISNPDRPLFDNGIDKRVYTNISWYILSIALLLAIMASFKIFFFILLFIGNYFLYSMPPFRLKRVPLFSKFIIALNSLIVLFIGYTLIGHTSIKVLPNEIVFYFLVIISLVLNFIDLKDYEGDKKNNIKTIPVLLGMKWSRYLIGLFFVIANIAVYLYFFSTILLIALILFSLVEFFLITKKNYNETPLFYTYLLSLLFFFVFLFSNFAPNFVS